MNENLRNILKEIVEKNGETILSDSKRVYSFLADLARDEPKPQKNALVKSLEHGFAQTLQSVSAQDREICKQQLAQRLHDEEGLDLNLCGETLELLSAVLFGAKKRQKKNLCKNCGKELQEGWKACPYCGDSQQQQAVKETNHPTVKSAIATKKKSTTQKGPRHIAESVKPNTQKELTAGQQFIAWLPFLFFCCIFGAVTVFTSSMLIVFLYFGGGFIAAMICYAMITAHFDKKNNPANKKQ